MNGRILLMCMTIGIAVVVLIPFVDVAQSPFDSYNLGTSALGCVPPPTPPTNPPDGGPGPNPCSDSGGPSGGSGGGSSGNRSIDSEFLSGPFPGPGMGGSGGGSDCDDDTSPCYSTNVADPVTSSTGEFHFSVTDLRINGPIPIIITRSYGNQRKYESPYGYNWTINYDARIITVDSTSLTYVTHEAGTKEYSKVSTNPDVYALAGNSSHYFVQTIDPAGFDLVVLNENLTYHFTTEEGNDYGRLKHIRDDYGNQVSFEHNSITGFITRITDTLGRDIRLYYNSSHRLSQIYDMTGDRRWYYYYSAAYDLSQVAYPDTDEYAGQNRIKFTYMYSNHNMIAAFDPQSQMLVRNYYSYDSGRQVYRVYKQERAGGSHDITYDAVNKVSTIIDPEGNRKEVYYNDAGLRTKQIVFMTDPSSDPNQYVTEYFYDDLMRNTLVIYPAGNCTAYTYNADHMRTGIYHKTSPGDPNDPNNLNVIAILYEYDPIYYTEPNTITDAMGNETKYEYNVVGRVIKITHPEIQTPNGLIAAVEELTYTTAGKIETYTNPAGAVRKYVYSETTGFLQEVVEDFGGEPEHLNLTTSYTYDDLGRIETVTKPDGGIVQVFCNTHDQITKVISPEGYETLCSYDQNGYRKQVKRETSDPLNPWQITEFTYDPWGNLTRKTDTLGNETSYEYDKNERLKIVTNALEQQTQFFYDERGLPVKVTDPNDKDILLAYDLNGNRISMTDTCGNTTRYEYDGLNRLIKTTDAEGHYRVRTLDKLGHVIREIAYDCNDTPENLEDDIALKQTRFAYNEAGDLVEYTVMADATTGELTPSDPNTDKVTRYAYAWANGPMLEETIYYGGYGMNDATAATTTHEYDVLDRKAWTEDPDGNVTIYAYDEAGRVARIQKQDLNPIGDDILQTTDFFYDLQGRLAYRIEKPQNPDVQSDASWQTTEYVYDALGYRIQEIRPNGVIVAYEYDLLGRRTLMVLDPYDAQSNPDGINQITEYGYDALGRRQWIAGYADSANPNTRQLTEYEYDGLGRVTKITYPDAATIEYTYTPAGKVSKRTDQRGWETYYTYDDVYNMTQKQVIVNSVTTIETFTYDGLRRILTAQKQEGQSTISQSVFEYNDIGRMSDAWETIGGLAAKHIEYAYDNAGNRTQTVYPDGSTIDRTNTWDGRIDTLSRNATTLFEYQYVGPRVARRLYNVPNVTADFAYDNIGRVTDIDYGESMVKFGYSYVADENNIYRKTFDHRAGDPYNEYTYDDLERLTDVTYHDSDTEAFVMDDLGNRAGNQTLREDGTINFTVDSSTNRYTTIGGSSMSHDDAGNLSVDKDGYQYTYDYENRVVKIEDSSSNDVAEYAYDALGRRICMVDAVASTTTVYYNSPEWQVLAEHDGAGNQQRYFVYGNYIDEPLVMNDGTNDYYYAHDHLYSTAALIGWIDEAWTVVERYEYDAYGKVHVTDASYTPRTVSAYANPYTFTGRRLDSLDGSNLCRMYYRHRDYSPELGRFLTHDPLGISIRLLFRKYPRFIGKTGPTARPLKHSTFTRTYLAIARSKNLEFFLNGVSDLKKGSYFEYPQYANGMSLYQLTMSQPLIYTDPYGLDANPIQETIDILLEWDPDHTYSEDECFAYCYCQAIGLSQDKLDTMTKEAVKKLIEEIMDNALKGPLTLCEAAANAAELGSCNEVCVAFAETGQPFEDPWGSAHGILVIAVLCLLLVGLFRYWRLPYET
ncbi:MAG: hypothetical protein JXA82_10815 [Sedimentisphaerales bacterium]|nr:hypothetical protein [Sedimentisphaerales bacterium]